MKLKNNINLILFFTLSCCSTLSLADIEKGNFYLKQGKSKEAFHEFYMSAQKNEVQGWTALGLAYINGTGVEKNLATGKEWLLKSANFGDSYAQYQLGVVYQKEEGKLSEAVKWYLKSAEQNYPSALYQLGDLYFFGNGVKEDPEKAITFYKRSDAYNDDKATLALGNILLNGYKVPADTTAAHSYFMKLYHKNNAQAAFVLGRIYKEGLGRNFDYNKSFEFYLKSALWGKKEGFSEAGFLAYKYQKDFVSAYALFRMAEHFGDNSGKDLKNALYLQLSSSDKERAEKILDGIATNIEQQQHKHFGK